MARDAKIVVSPAEARRFIPASKMVERATLPAPPSANNLFYTHLNRRHKSRDYREWFEVVLPMLAFLESPESLPCVYSLLYTGKWNSQRDGDNAQKPVLDACVAACVIPKDSLKYVRGGEWLYEPSEGDPEVIVWFESLPPREIETRKK